MIARGEASLPLLAVPSGVLVIEVLTDYVGDSSGEVWVMEYPHSALQGGGSPTLRLVR